MDRKAAKLPAQRHSTKWKPACGEGSEEELGDFSVHSIPLEGTNKLFAHGPKSTSVNISLDMLHVLFKQDEK